SGAVCGFKYLSFDGDETGVKVLARGKGRIGFSTDMPDKDVLGSVSLDSAKFKEMEISFGENPVPAGNHAVYFRILDGSLDFAEFEII
ncbi:MAG: hypothetical protein K2G19_05880, partial [Lachnospiraceae bacterium]|nr:hypothetical protein [Lachnospiraceae bacterium]